MENNELYKIAKKNATSYKPNKVNIMKFKSSVDEYESLSPTDEGYIEINLVGSCNKNVWNGNTSAQIFMTDYQVINKMDYYF